MWLVLFLIPLFLMPVNAVYDVSSDTQIIEMETIDSDQLLDDLVYKLIAALSAGNQPAVMSLDDVDSLALDSDGYPFYGSSWSDGSASGFGSGLLLWPSDRRDGYIGLDPDGYIFNVSDDSWSGVFYDSSGTSYTVSFGAFAYPRIRVYSGNSSTYETLYFTPGESNVVFPDQPTGTYDINSLLPFLSVVLLGGVWLCCMKRS